VSATNARDQVNRLLALVPYLQGRGEISVAEAAREFGVTPRVIRRDINVLLFCGLPGLGMGDLIEVDFEALEGEDVIRLSNADYLARPLRLDTTEAAALVVGLRTLLEGSGDEEREVVERALRKVEGRQARPPASPPRSPCTSPTTQASSGCASSSPPPSPPGARSASTTARRSGTKSPTGWSTRSPCSPGRVTPISTPGATGSRTVGSSG
jgi:predicted DNA-binding transcriptional regulator YafY